MTKISEYEEKLEEKVFFHVLAANPPNLTKKEQNENMLQSFIDDHLANYLPINDIFQ